MTREKRMEALSWLIEQADAAKNGAAGVKFSDGVGIERCDDSLRVHLWGNGFNQLALAASQTIKFEPTQSGGEVYEYFLFDGVKFFRLVKEGEEDA